MVIYPGWKEKLTKSYTNPNNKLLEMMLRFKVPKKSAEVGDKKPQHI